MICVAFQKGSQKQKTLYYKYRELHKKVNQY